MISKAHPIGGGVSCHICLDNVSPNITDLLNACHLPFDLVQLVKGFACSQCATWFESTMSRAEFVIYEQLVRDEKHFKRENVYQFMDYNLDRFEEYGTIQFLGNMYGAIQFVGNMNHDTLYHTTDTISAEFRRTRQQWAIVDYAGGKLSQRGHYKYIDITNFEFFMQSLRDEQTSDYIGIEMYIYRVIAKETVSQHA